MDPQEFRSLGHQVIDELADYLDTIEDQRVFPDVDSRHLEATTRPFKESNRAASSGSGRHGSRAALGFGPAQ